MTEILRTISSLSILVFAVSSMLSAGFSFTFGDVVGPLREPNRIARALAGNFVLAPLLALAIAHAFSLDSALTLGLILLGSAAGAPFLIKLIAMAAGDQAMGTSLLVLLIPMTVVFMPFIVPLLAPEAAVSATSIATPLFLTMLLPLVFGLLVTELAPRWAKRLAPIAGAVSTITLVLVIVTTMIIYARDLREIVASSTSLAVILFVLGAFAIGYVVASPHPERRVVLGLGTAQRNIAAATVVAVENTRVPDTLALANADTLVLVVVAGVLELLVLFPVARWLRGHQREATGIPPGAELASSRT
jgi:BASS family bile acid:Na+ symporter